MNQNFKYNDGGRAASTMPNERLDCTVRAYALARGISYEKSHSEFAGFGRKYKRACKFLIFMKEKHPEIKHYKTNKPRPRVKTILKKAILKNAIVRISGHCFCVKNNIVLDTCESDHYIVKDIWFFD